MKKFLLNCLLLSFATVILTGQSWAFGSRHHHGGGGQGYDGQDGSYSSNNDGHGSNDGYNSGSNSGSNGSNSGSNPQVGGDGNGYNPGSNPPVGGGNHFPACPAPEPMSLSLLGTGLAGIFLKRKIS